MNSKQNSDSSVRSGESFDPVIPGSTPRQPLQPNVVDDTSRSASGSEEPDQSVDLNDADDRDESAPAATDGGPGTDNPV